MKYVLMMHTPRDGYRQYMKWPRKVLEANAAFMSNFTKHLTEAGEFVSAAGLASPEQAVRVRAGENGEPVTDGVFPESKEFLAGFWIVDVESGDRALEIAAEAGAAPGAEIKSADGQVITHFWIEVRQLLDGRSDLE
jgi:hypothetical protein